MRVLFDNGTPRGVAAALSDHTVEEAPSHGWDTLRNGELLDGTLVARLNEPRGHPNAVRAPSDAPLEDVRHSQLPGDDVDADIRVLVLHRRRSRDHPEQLRVQPGQLRDHFVGETVAEVLLFLVAAQVLERQYRQHDSPPGSRSRCRFFDSGKKAVPTSWNGLDESRRLGAVGERQPDLPDAVVQTLIEVDERVVGPDFLPDLFPRQELSGAARQEGEHFHGLRLKLDQPAASAQLAVRRIELETVEPQPRHCGRL